MIESLFDQLGFWTPVCIFILSLATSSLKKKKKDLERLIMEDAIKIPDLEGILE